MPRLRLSRRGATSPAQGQVEQAVERLATSGAALTLELVDIGANVAAISASADVEAATFAQLRSASTSLLAMTHEVATTASEARAGAEVATHAVQASRERFVRSASGIEELARWSSDAAERLENVVSVLNELRSVTAQISQIADQSKILSVNAKIEASRSANNAFHVIASNVQELADRSAASADAVTEGMGQLAAAIDVLAEAGHTTAAQAQEVEKDAVLIRSELDVVVEAISATDQAMSWIATGIAHAERTLTEVDQGVGVVFDHSTERTRHLGEAKNRITGLRSVGEQLLRVRAEAGIPCTDTTMIEVTRQGAAQLQAIFEDAVAKGRLSMEDLFDEHYVLVPGSNPPQYRTRFSAFTDDVAPSVQEPILAEHDVVEGCCLHDRNGYRPTMNTAFSQSQGSDPVWNAKHARSRSRAKDEAALTASRSTRPYLLQAYRRTANGTVQLCRDASVPITVRGRHWGCLRTVYVEATT